MNRIASVLFCLFLALLAGSNARAGAAPGTTLEHLRPGDAGQPCGDYFGQEPPGSTPALFAPGIVSAELGAYGTVVFSCDQTEAYWVADESPDLWWSRREDGCWTKPRVLPLLENHRINSPVLSADDQRLYFLAAGRDAGGHDVDDRIWFADRTPDGWSAPRCLGPAVNGVSKHFQFSVSTAGDIYFGGGPGGDVHVARRTADGHEPAEPLGAPVDSDGPDMDPCISPDGSCLIITRFLADPPGAFLFASFRDEGGAWTEPAMLKDVLQSHHNDSGARFSRDGRYLFFQSCRPGSEPNRSVFWVEAAVLDRVAGASD